MGTADTRARFARGRGSLRQQQQFSLQEKKQRMAFRNPAGANEGRMRNV
jgi:hypothetical protein